MVEGAMDKILCSKVRVKSNVVPGPGHEMAGPNESSEEQLLAILVLCVCKQIRSMVLE